MLNLMIFQEDPLRLSLRSPTLLLKLVAPMMMPYNWGAYDMIIYMRMCMPNGHVCVLSFYFNTFVAKQRL